LAIESHYNPEQLKAWALNEFDVFKTIAESLSERKSLTALSNYQVLNNNVSYVNNLFRESLSWLSKISNEMNQSLKSNRLASSEAKDNTYPLYYFRKIIPRLISNGIQISQKFQDHTTPDDRSNVTLENVYLLHKSFADYSELVTSTRQFIDSMISDSYQMVCLDPKLLNYQVLSSLSSFEKYATKSIWHSVASDELVRSLRAFNSLRFQDRANSRISKCEHQTFAQKVDYIFSQLGIRDDEFADELKNIFKFSSEFTHVGYVSTMFSSTYDSECVFGDEIGPYLPSTENFGELKYRLMETAVRLYSEVYLPSLQNALKRLMGNFSRNVTGKVDVLIDALNNGLNTRNRQYYFFIRGGLVVSGEDIQLPCRCGEIRVWKPPHDRSELFCQKCGSSFNLLEMEGDPGYIITGEGPVRVIGSTAPDLEDLPEEELKSLWEKCREIIKNHS
jgi:hypothetical protein